MMTTDNQTQALGDEGNVRLGQLNGYVVYEKDLCGAYGAAWDGEDDGLEIRITRSAPVGQPGEWHADPVDGRWACGMDWDEEYAPKSDEQAQEILNYLEGVGQ